MLYTYTLPQFNSFLLAAEQNRDADSTLLANIQRVSYHGNKREFSKFLDVLMKSFKSSARGKVIKINDAKGIALVRQFLSGRGRKIDG